MIYFIKWEIVRLIDRGGFGSIHEVTVDGKAMAMKTIKPPGYISKSEREERLEMQRKEIKTLWHLKHEKIVQFYGVNYGLDNITYLFMELMVPFTVLFEDKEIFPMSFMLLLHYGLQLLCGLKYTHSKGYIHKDLKCNLLLYNKL